MVENVEDNGTLNEKSKENPSKSSSKIKKFFEKRWYLLFVIFLLLLVIVCVTVILMSLIPRLRKELKTDFRLPLNLIPEHYSLKIQPHLNPNHLTFEGNVVITFICLNTTDKIILHGEGLNIHQNSLDINANDGSSILTVLRIQRDPNNQLIIFTIDENLEVGRRYSLHIRYDGKLQNNSRGFFSSKYKENDIDKYMAATDFQTHFARMAFPCFDEPSFKATFTISIVRRKEHMSLSNMPLLKTKERDEEWVVDMYLTTVVMPTYLVAFAIGDFKRIQRERVSIWCLKNINMDFHSLLNVSHFLLNYFEKYLNVNYDLPKLDHLLVPNYSGAMENWGLVTYGEEKVIKNINKNFGKVVGIFSHETVHQWFGNLVTPKWWDDLWLSEGLTTYLQYFGSGAILPDHRMDESFVDVGSETNYECSKLFVRLYPSIKRSINNYADMSTAETPLNYGKAAYLIRMMHLILGDETFKMGLASYLRENAYGSVDSEELWKHLTQAQTKQPVIRLKEMMDPWLFQTGYPIITAIRNYHRNTAHITQTSCLNYENQTSDIVWNVPITLMSRKEPIINFTVKKWLTQKSGFIDDLPGKNNWILLNVEQVGYFRVNYDETNWKLLLWQLQHNFLEIPLLNRIQILNDVMFFANKGDISHRLALDIFSYFPFEKDVLVLNSIEYSRIGKYLPKYENAVYHTRVEGKWKKFIQYCLGPIFDRYLSNWASGEIKEKLLSSKDSYVDILCMNGYRNCLNAVGDIIKDLINGTMLNETRLTSRSACGFIYYGSRADWERVYKLYTESKDETEKKILSESLGCTSDKDMAERFVENAWKPGKRFKDISLEVWIEMLEYLKREWSSISKDEYSNVLLPLIFDIKDISSYEMVKDFYEEIKEDIDRKQLKVIEDSIDAKLKQLSEWKKVFKEIRQWLQNEEWLNININELDDFPV